MQSWTHVREWYLRNGIYVTITTLVIAIPSIVRDLTWWIDLFTWLISSAPNWIVPLLKALTALVSPVLDAYRSFTGALFGWLTWDIPAWASSLLPPLLLVIVQLFTSMMAFYRAFTRTTKNLMIMAELTGDYDTLEGIRNGTLSLEDPVKAEEFRRKFRAWANEQAPLEGHVSALENWLVQAERTERLNVVGRRHLKICGYLTVVLFAILGIELAYQFT